MRELQAIRFIQGTKVSHDYDGEKVNCFPYSDLISRNIPCIGIPCKQNSLLIVDVDVEGESHRHDGTEFWERFSDENNIPSTYTVGTPSGGKHFYFALPESVNPHTFNPPKTLALGIDLKWNGWVGAPPTIGYSVLKKSIQEISVAPPALLAYMARINNGGKPKTFDITPGGNLLPKVNNPFTETQIAALRLSLEWVQNNTKIPRDMWINGIHSIASGVPAGNDELLEELITKWTCNGGFVPGDVEHAMATARKSDKSGKIGPGTITNYINQLKEIQGVPLQNFSMTRVEILELAGVHYTINETGGVKIEGSETNISYIIGKMIPKEKLFYDARTDLYVYEGKSTSDSALVNLILPMIQSNKYGIGIDKVRRNTVAAALDVLMASRKVDPHQEYLKGLKWDGVPRIEKFFSTYVGVEDTEYHRILGRNFWTALAARGSKPGCKFDSIFVLEGYEGIAKSSLIEAIGGEYTCAPTERDALRNSEILRQMHQAIIVELPELLGLVGETSETVKGFLSKSFDSIRSLYARKAEINPRSFIIVGTTNSSKYLTSGMGNRRFWPVVIPKSVEFINVKGIKSDRDQLFAEGMEFLKDGYAFWHMPPSILDPIVSRKVIEEPLTAPINECIQLMGPIWSTTDLYRRLEAGGFVSRGLTPVLINRIENALNKLEFEKSLDATSGSHMWVKKIQKISVDDFI